MNWEIIDKFAVNANRIREIFQDKPNSLKLSYNELLAEAEEDEILLSLYIC